MEDPSNRRMNQRSGAVVLAQDDGNKSRALMRASDDAMTDDASLSRTSSLAAPIMLLEGHQGEILTMKFSHDGQRIASSGVEKIVYLWSAQGECGSIATIGNTKQTHKAAILELCWTNDDTKIITASADGSVMVWDVEKLERVKRIFEHDACVNAVATNNVTRGASVLQHHSQMYVTGSDDGTSKVFDLRSEEGEVAILNQTYPVLSVQLDESSNCVYTAGLDSIIRCWDIRRSISPLYLMEGHTDSITGIRLNRNGTQLCSTSFDNSTRVWDCRAFTTTQTRQQTILFGSIHGLDRLLLRPSWDAVGAYVACGSADLFVNIWSVVNVKAPRVAYKLPGHSGTVTEVDFSPIEPVIASAATDRKIFLGEIEPEKTLAASNDS